MEKELWLDQQEIEQLLSGTLFWQDVQKRADIKIVHKLNEGDSPAGDKQNQNRAFLMEQTFSHMTVSETPGSEISDNISKDIPGDGVMGVIQETAASVSMEAAETTETNEKTTEKETISAEAELDTVQNSAPELTEKAAFKIETEEFSEEVIIEEIIEEVNLDGETVEKEIAAKKETFREERIIFAANKEKRDYFKEAQAKEISEAKHTDLHNTMSFSWDSEELQMENESGSGSQIEKMERSLEKTFGNGNEFKKLILERELEAGFEDRPIGGIKMFILLGVFAAITIGVWVFFLSK